MEAAEDLLERALLAGAREAEVYHKVVASFEVATSDGRPLARRHGRESGLGLRLLTAGGTEAFVALSSGEPLPRSAELGTVLASLAATGATPRAPLPDRAQSVAGAELDAAAASQPLVDEACREVEAGALSLAEVAAATARVRAAMISVLVINSRGLRSYATALLASLSLSVAARRGRHSFELSEVRLERALDPARARAFGREVALRAARCLGGVAAAWAGPALVHPSFTALLIAAALPRLEALGASSDAQRPGPTPGEPRLTTSQADAPGGLPFDGCGASRLPARVVAARLAEPALRAPSWARRSYAEPPTPGFDGLVLAGSAHDPAPPDDGLEILAVEIVASAPRWLALGSGVRHRRGRPAEAVTGVPLAFDGSTLLERLTATAGPSCYYPAGIAVAAPFALVDPPSQAAAGSRRAAEPSRAPRAPIPKSRTAVLS